MLFRLGQTPEPLNEDKLAARRLLKDVVSGIHIHFFSSFLEMQRSPGLQ